MKQPVKGKLISKVDGGIITQPFGSTTFDYSPFKGHTGIDLATFEGDNIYSATEGDVFSIGTNPNSKAGLSLGIMDKDRMRCYYGHLKEFNVKMGDKVKEGDIIGKMGKTGTFCFGAHLHFQIQYFDENYNIINYNNGYGGAIDPLPLLKNNMLKIIGDSFTKKQYLVGEDGSYAWIYNPALLNYLHNAGICDKTKVEWVKSIPKNATIETLALIK